MKVVILAGGYGTRLYPLTLDIPKALLKIGNRVLLDFIVDKIKPFGSDVYVVTNNKFYTKVYDWSKKVQGLNIEVVNDNTNTPEERLGAIGDIRFIVDSKGIDEDILIIGSDNIFDWELGGFVEFSLEKQAFCIGAYNIKDLNLASRFGVVKIDSSNKIIDMQEKPSSPQSPLIATCIYYFPRNKLPLLDEYIRENTDRDASGRFVEWVYKKEDVFCYVFNGIWLDIGHKDSLEEANLKFGGSK